MPQNDPYTADARRAGSGYRASALAESAMSILSQRQPTSNSGIRRFIFDYLLRSVLSRQGFDAMQMLDELRGHRLPVDTIIDAYVPMVARRLGEMWMEDDLDFAGVTVGSMRLQALLSYAARESVDLVRPAENAPALLIVVPLGEQHSLGAFVLAAQLRRLGARVEMSFGETTEDVLKHLLCDPPSAVLFTSSARASLESVARLVQSIRNITRACPLLILGGNMEMSDIEVREATDVDVVTNLAREAMSRTVRHVEARRGGKST